MRAAINHIRGETAELIYCLMMQICEIVEAVKEFLHIGIVRVINSRGFQRINGELFSLLQMLSTGPLPGKLLQSRTDHGRRGCAWPSRRLWF
ncbi:hypothetical protein TNCV_4783411 [Trichonephila clavipes]|nr:hypothetical protein TNCV_4783411 [Trichonephila clavipes]